MIESTPAAPSHVPADLIRDVDYFRLEAVDGDIHLAWKRLQEGPDIIWTPRQGGHWIATRGADIEEIFRDPARFSSIVANVPKESKPFRLPLLEYDPPDHTAFRQLLAPALSPRAISALEFYARDLTVSLIEGFHARGECDFIAEFSQHMPIGIFLTMAGLPQEDREWLLPFADLCTRSPEAKEQLAAFNRVVEYVSEKIRERSGKRGSDLISLITNGEVGGRVLSFDEAVGLCSLVMFAGLDTVVSSLGFFMRHLALHPGHRRRLAAESGLIPMAIEEMLRRYGIVTMARQVTQDLVYKGVQMREGDMVLLPTLLYGLDERKFERPLEVDFDRPNKVHLAFGAGAHRCLWSGMSLRLHTDRYPLSTA